MINEVFFAATTATEAHDPAAWARRHAHTEPLAVLRLGKYSPHLPPSNPSQNEGHHSEATWKIHLHAPRSPTSGKNPSLLTRMSTIRRTRRADSRSPARDAAKARTRQANQSADNLSMLEEANTLLNSQRNSEASIFVKRNSDVNFLEPEDDATSITSLSKRHKGAIRAIRKLKYLVAKRKFKEALKPYDIKVSKEFFSKYA